MAGRKRNRVIWLVGILLLVLIGLVVGLTLFSGQSIQTNTVEATASAITEHNATIEAQIAATQQALALTAQQEAEISASTTQAAIAAAIAATQAAIAQQNADISALTAQAANATIYANAAIARTQAAIALQTAESRATQQTIIENLTETALAQASTVAPPATATPPPTQTTHALGIGDIALTATALASQLQSPVPSRTPTPDLTSGIPLDVTARPTLSNVQMTATALAILFEQTAISPTSESVGGAETVTPDDAGDSPTETIMPLPSLSPFYETQLAATSFAQQTEQAIEVALTQTAIVASPTPAQPSANDVALTATALAILLQPGQLTAVSSEIPTFRPTLPPTQTPSATPLVIAAANLLIRSDVSGEVIGDGTLRVYAPQSANYPETARVELELHLDNLYITPTPTGERGTPVPRSTTVANPAGATPTPYLPIITDQGIPVYQRMGATLLCSEQSFRGCDISRDQSQAKIVGSEITTWSWIIAPEQNAAGLQDLQLDVWLVERNLDGALEYLDLPGTPYRFKIEVNPATGSNVPLLIGGIVVIIVLIGGAFLVSQRRITPSPAQPLVPKNAPLVFISYRRGPSWGQARSIEQSLRERGANVFIDIDDINEGHFAETIEKAIQDCDYFVAVLAPGTLESVWVRREIASALAAQKTIVPLLMDGFRLDAENIPSEIRDIASHNAITVLPEFYQEAINRLAKRFLRLDDKGE